MTDHKKTSFGEPDLELGDPPPLEEPQRAQWFKATTPASFISANDGYFQLGIRASEAEFNNIKEQISQQCNKLKLFKDSSVRGTEIPRDKYQKAQEKALEKIKELGKTYELDIESVPSDWLLTWARVIVQRIWVDARRKYKDEILKAARKGQSQPTKLPDFDFQLNVIGPDQPLDEILNTAKIYAYECVRAQDNPHVFRNYQLSLFQKLMQNELLTLDLDTGSIAQSEALNLKHGELIYLRAPNVPKKITQQSEFGRAVEELFKNRHNDFLPFYFRMENESQKKLREAREMAEHRIRSGISKSRGSSPAPTTSTSRGSSLASSRNPSPAPGPASKRLTTSQGSSQRKGPPTPLRTKQSSMLTSPRKYEPVKSAQQAAPVKHFQVSDSPTSKFSDSSESPANTPVGNSFGSRAKGTLSKARHSIMDKVKGMKLPMSPITPRAPPFETASINQWDKYERLQYMYKIFETKQFAKGIGGEEGKLPDPADANPSLIRLEQEAAEEETLSDIKDSHEFLVAELARLQNDPILTQMRGVKDLPTDISRWHECCKFFQLDYHKVGIDELVPIAGLKHKLYQYQAFGVFWQMVRGRHVGGGFVADEMGLGKTVSFLAYIVVERQLAFLWKEVIESRAKNDKKHLSENSTFNKCPSERERAHGWIACPCTNASLSSVLQPKPGARLSLVPVYLVKQWREQWNVHIDTSESRLGMKLIISHPPAFPSEGRYHNLDARHQANVKLLAANKESVAVVETSKGAVKGPVGSGPILPKHGQERLLLLTTANDFKKCSKAYEFDGRVPVYKADGVLNWEGAKRTALVFGIGMIDECHEDYLKGKGAVDVLTKLNPGPLPFLWGYSGTPLRDTPRGLEGIIYALEQHRTSKTHAKDGQVVPMMTYQHFPVREVAPQHDIKQLRYHVLDQLCADFQRYVKKDLGYRDLLPEFEEHLMPFLETYMIRRTVETPWFNRPLIKLKPHYHTDVFVEAQGLQKNQRLQVSGTMKRPLLYTFANDPENLQIEILRYTETVLQKEKLAALGGMIYAYDMKTDAERIGLTRPSKLSLNMECQVLWRLRVLSTFPLLIYYLKHPWDETGKSTKPLNLTLEEILSNGWATAKYEKQSPYYKDINLLVATSPKACWLYKFIRDEIISKKNSLGQERKLVIITSFPVVALILKIFIEQYFPQALSRVALLRPRMKQKDRTDLVHAFTSSSSPSSATTKQNPSYQFIIGPPTLLGQGLDLTRAQHVVLMEPDYLFSRELQAYARVNRIGQKGEQTWSYRLIGVGCQGGIEEKIVQRAVARGEVPGKRVDDEEKERVVVSSLAGIVEEGGGGGGGGGQMKAAVREHGIHSSESYDRGTVSSGGQRPYSDFEFGFHDEHDLGPSGPSQSQSQSQSQPRNTTSKFTETISPIEQQ